VKAHPSGSGSTCKRAFHSGYGPPIRPSLSRRSPSSSRQALIVENVDRTPGLRQRIHSGLFERWRAFERRNRKQTRWEIGMEEWV
ncbi:hypothetical protein, partial [Enterococcus faecium]|uniref:hypothetical protein n=1 Tax=Enterococcus faecium TaxID=1352 RepID=UPI003F8C6807